MSRRPARFTQADVVRAIKGLVQADKDVVLIFRAGGDVEIIPRPEALALPGPVANRPRRVP